MAHIDIKVTRLGNGMSRVTVTSPDGTSSEKDVFDDQVDATVERTLKTIRSLFGEAVGKTTVLVPGSKQ